MNTEVVFVSGNTQFTKNKLYRKDKGFHAGSFYNFCGGPAVQNNE